MMNRKRLVATIGFVVLCGIVTFILSVCRPEREAAATAVMSSVTNDLSSVGATVAPVVVPAPEVALSSRGTKVFRVTADRTITETLRRTLADFGARVIAPVSARAVLVEASPAVVNRLAKDARFTTEDVLPAKKVQKRLADRCAENPKSSVKVSIIGLAVADREQLSAFVSAQGGKLLHSPLGPEALAAEVPAALVASLAARGDVRWIEPAPKDRLFNDKTVVEAGANVDRLRTKHVLKGRGQKVTVCDSGLDKGLLEDVHLDFSGRVKEIVHVGAKSARYWKYTASLADHNGHGTHVAGTVLGDGACSEGLYKGMAPRAELYLEATGDTTSSTVWIDSYLDILSRSVANDAYIHSDSWGSAEEYGDYNSSDVLFDSYLWENPELLVVVAAGNSGDKDSGDHKIAASPACAKNVLTVGNTMSTRQTSSWVLLGNPENLNPTSSRGPTTDGRIKPEVAAPGTAVYSTRSSRCSRSPISGNKYYTEMTGTSMATPLVSGAAALVREWLADRRGMTEPPTAALMKAILAGGGVSMTGVGAHKVGGSWKQFNLPQEIPNTDYGWGRVNLEETLYPSGDRAIKFVDRIPFQNGVDWTYDLTTTNAAPLDVQLCWIDYPGDPSASQSLVNDLDLIVSNKTTGAVWCGNGVDGGDHTNTMESVRIAAADAPAGEYAVIVRGYAVAFESTAGGAAAIYIRGAFEDETAPDPLYVRNVRTDERYEFLNEALKEVQSGDTLEILKPVELAKSVTLAVKCTIVATNADPMATLVTRTGGAAITLATGAELTLTNVVFMADDASTAVTTSAGSRLILSGTVGVGTVAVEDAEGILFAAPLALVGDSLSVNAPNGCSIGAAFGHWKGDYLSSSNAASRVNNLRNDELGGIAEKMSGRLVWGVIPCNPEDAKCVVGGDGIPTTYCRTFSQALQVALQRDSVLMVRKSVEMASSATLSHDLTLVSANDAVLSFGNDAGFVVPEGTRLNLTNIVVGGAGTALANCPFQITGGEMTLCKGAVLKDLVRGGSADNPGGAVFLDAGTLTMLSGAKISGCSAVERGSYNAYGGGIYAWGGTLNLFGGEITLCTATLGGGVYADMEYGDLVVNLAGDLRITGNGHEGIKDEAGATIRISDNLRINGLDLYDSETIHRPTVTNALAASAEIGIGYDAAATGNQAGEVFAILASTLTDEEKATAAKAFSNDIYLKLRAKAVGMELCWTESTVDPEEAQALAIYGEGTANAVTNYFETVVEAFANLTNDAMIVVLTNQVYLTEDVTIRHHVIIRPDVVSSSVNYLYRDEDMCFTVSEGASLVISNLVFHGLGSYKMTGDIDPFFYVNGGSLTLGANAVIYDVYGDGSPSACAVYVINDGVFRMEKDSWIGTCANEYDGSTDGVIKDADAGLAGGVALQGGTAYLRGGTIYECYAQKSGAIFIGNGSVARVSGSFYAVRNGCWKDSPYLPKARSSNITYDGTGLICLDGEYTGWAGVSSGWNLSAPGSSNVFGFVEYAGDPYDLSPSAVHFRKDPYLSDAGIIVTNGAQTLLVWSSAIKEDAQTGGYYYEDENGKRYGAVVAPAPAAPSPAAPSQDSTGTVSVQSIERLSETEWQLVIANLTPGCEYRLCHSDDLSKEFSEGEWIQVSEDAATGWVTNVVLVEQAPSSLFWKVEARPSNDLKDE